jgi:hypothetical protein
MIKLSIVCQASLLAMVSKEKKNFANANEPQMGDLSILLMSGTFLYERQRYFFPLA